MLIETLTSNTPNPCIHQKPIGMRPPGHKSEGSLGTDRPGTSGPTERAPQPLAHSFNPDTAQEKKTDQPMNYEILAMIIGFTTLAVLMNRNTAAVISELDELQNEMRQRLDETRKDTNNRLDSVRTDVTKSRTEMN